MAAVQIEEVTHLDFQPGLPCELPRCRKPGEAATHIGRSACGCTALLGDVCTALLRDNLDRVGHRFMRITCDLCGTSRMMTYRDWLYSIEPL